MQDSAQHRIRSINDNGPGDCQASLVAQTVKYLPAMQETWVQSLGREDPLEKEMATHSSILVWRIPWTEEPGGLQSRGLQRVGLDWMTNTFMVIVSITTFIIFIISGLTKLPPPHWTYVYLRLIHIDV